MLPRWHVTWRGWRGQPIFQPEVAARAIVDAAFDSRNRKAWIGLPTWKAILANKFAPALLDRYLAKVGYSSQLMEDFDAIVRYAGLFGSVSRSGHDGSAVVALPRLELVVAVAAGNYDDPNHGGRQW
jgi:hypothetical protein